MGVTADGIVELLTKIATGNVFVYALNAITLAEMKIFSIANSNFLLVLIFFFF